MLSLFTPAQLAALAEAYCAATGITLHELGAKISHAKLMKRLMAGQGCSLGNAEKATRWFIEHWPADVPWPAAIPRQASATEAA